MRHRRGKLSPERLAEEEVVRKMRKKVRHNKAKRVERVRKRLVAFVTDYEELVKKHKCTFHGEHGSLHPTPVVPERKRLVGSTKERTDQDIANAEEWAKTWSSMWI